MASSKPEPVVTVYHYTDKKGCDAILESKKIHQSADGRYGSGTYVTGLAPGESLDKQTVLNNNYDGAAGGYPDRADYAFKVEVPQSQVTRHACTDPANAGSDIATIRGDVDLRLINFSLYKNSERGWFRFLGLSSQLLASSTLAMFTDSDWGIVSFESGEYNFHQRDRNLSWDGTSTQETLQNEKGSLQHVTLGFGIKFDHVHQGYSRTEETKETSRDRTVRTKDSYSGSRQSLAIKVGGSEALSGGLGAESHRSSICQELRRSDKFPGVTDECNVQKDFAGKMNVTASLGSKEIQFSTPSLCTRTTETNTKGGVFFDSVNETQRVAVLGVKLPGSDAVAYDKPSCHTQAGCTAAYETLSRAANNGDVKAKDLREAVVNGALAFGSSLGTSALDSAVRSSAEKFDQNTGTNLADYTTGITAKVSMAATLAKNVMSCPEFGAAETRTWTWVDPETRDGEGFAVQRNGISEVINVINYTGFFDEENPNPNLCAFLWAVDLLSLPLECMESVRNCKADLKLFAAWTENMVGKSTVRKLDDKVFSILMEGLFKTGLMKDLQATIQGKLVNTLMGDTLKKMSAAQVFEVAHSMLEASRISNEALVLRGVKEACDFGARCAGTVAKEALEAAAQVPPWWKLWKAKPSWLLQQAGKNAGAIVAVGVGIFESITSAIYTRMTKRDRMAKLMLKIGMTPCETADEVEETSVNRRYRRLSLVLHPDKAGPIAQDYFSQVTNVRDDLVTEVINYRKSLMHKAWDFTKVTATKSALNALGFVGTALGFIASNHKAIVPRAKSWFSGWW